MNFILRTINKETNFSDNIIIGKYYQLYRWKSLTEDEWRKITNKFFPNMKDDSEIEAILIADEPILIHKSAQAYIMVESGKTFEKV